ncbi:MAG: MaoC/PaaZ C-terminal domain-containing protein [Candidatus Lernaella stagnicola]|nr:MaoC/PaaZ C-terminal domain-containing protein [Candidatus Lernaella stagnicola]
MTQKATEELALSTALVGRKLRSITREVTWRDTTNYAAAVADPNPMYLDDSQPAGLVAPPLFAVALTWPLAVDLPQQWGELMPPEVVARMVHAQEHLIFHRPVRPGDVLTLTGECAALVPIEAGTLLYLHIDARDRDGEPVFTEFSTPLFRGVSCPDGPKGKNNLPHIPPLAESSSALWRVEEPISREASFLYDGCTDIVFPIHTSTSFARTVGLPDIILQGTATLAKAAREIVNREAGGQPARLKELACRFVGMVAPDSEIGIEMTARESADERTLLGFRVTNGRGAAAISHGFAKVE